MSNFIHLNVHSGYSISESTIPVPEIVAFAKENGMDSIAMTDINNIAGALEFQNEALKKGIKPLIGMQIRVQINENDTALYNVLVKDYEGFVSLNRIISTANLENKILNEPIVKKEWLESISPDSLIVMTNGKRGYIGERLAQNDIEAAKNEVEFLKTVFGPSNVFLELHRTGEAGEEAYIDKAVDLAIETQTPVVATNPAVFKSKDDWAGNELRTSISHKININNISNKNFFTREQYLKTAEEMEELFSDIPSAIKNTRLIADKCAFAMDTSKKYLPKFPLEEGTTEAEEMSRLSNLGLQERMKFLFPDPAVRESKMQEYQDRLDFEMNVINRMGFPGYFLIVQDFINWAKRNDIPVGPGRGSGAGSLVAYALGITDLDPIANQLLFERFLNPDRVSLPDFDIDFCKNRRLEVVEYVKERYGHERVVQIATVGKIGSKSAVKDVARAMGVHVSQAQELSDLIPSTGAIPWSLEEALEKDDNFMNAYMESTENKMIIDAALKLENIPRQFGVHAAGVVIAPNDISEFAPVFTDKDKISTQFYKEDVEKLGLVKFDFLGLDTLTIIHTASKIIKKTNPDFRIELIDFSDESVYETYASGDTVGVFQFESEGMRQMLKELKPNSFEDIVAAAALYRPGPLETGMVEDFISRKNGRTKTEYLHPLLEEILKPTYGVIVYQEQVMQIAQKMANYSLGQADLLRRAMGKKDPKEMDKQRAIFVEGAVKNNVDEQKATDIFDLMEKFAGYGFNKSHSAAYALLSYQTAFLKTYYPDAFYSAILTSKSEDTKFEKMAEYIQDAQKNGIRILPPDINKSKFGFEPEGKGVIRYGFSGIKGVGESAAMVIAHERENGEFKDFMDFSRRVGNTTINKGTKTTLIYANCFKNEDKNTLAFNVGPLQDFLKEQQKAAEPKKAKKPKKEKISKGASILSEAISVTHVEPLADSATALDAGSKVSAEVKDDVNDKSSENSPTSLDSSLASPVVPAEYVYQENPEPMSRIDFIAKEKDLFGLYLFGHPMEEYEKIVPTLTEFPSYDELLPGKGDIYLAGVIMDVYERKTVSGKQMASVTISDKEHTYRISMFEEEWKANRQKIKKGQFVCMSGRTSPKLYRDQVQFNPQNVYTLEETERLCTKYVKIPFNEPNGVTVLENRIRDILRKKEYECPEGQRLEKEFAALAVLYKKPDQNQGYKQILPKMDINFTKELRQEIEELGVQPKFGAKSYHELYFPPQKTYGMKRDWKKKTSPK